MAFKLGNQKAMRIEYLVIISADSAFCRDKAAFNSFLQSDADIKISKGVLKHKEFECVYEIKSEDAKGNKNRFYNVKLECDSENNLDKFLDLLKAVRTRLHNISEKKPQVLWDDVSFHYAKKAYPLVHQIENLMRKLITKFMLTNVGLGWTKEAIPEDLRKNSRSENADNNNYLYETDFKDLSTFLFDEYRTSDIRNLNDKIRRLESDTISAVELKEFLPKSNWERYFREHVNCEGTYLEARWEKLYKLRCKIAHNNTFTRADYDQTVMLINEVEPKIIEAITKLDSIEVPEEERDELAEAAAIRTSTFYGEYIKRWKEIEKLLYEAYVLANPSLEEYQRRRLQHSPSVVIGKLYEAEFIDRETGSSLTAANQLRNRIVHEPEHYLSSDDLSNGISNLNDLFDKISGLIFERSERKPGQNDAGSEGKE
jgi:hypothetical protein